MSRILGSVERRRETKYYITMLAIFLKIPKMWHPKGLKMEVFDNPTVV